MWEPVDVSLPVAVPDELVLLRVEEDRSPFNGFTGGSHISVAVLFPAACRDRARCDFTPPPGGQ